MLRHFSVLCCVVVSVLCLAIVAQQHDIPPSPSVNQTVLIRPSENANTSCTGTVVAPQIVLTATHCLGDGAKAVFAELSTPAAHRNLRPKVIIGDFAMLSFEAMDTDKWTAIPVDLSSDAPRQGEPIWAVGLVDIDDKYVPVASYGLSLGQTVTFKGLLYHVTSIPVIKGMSGGPVYHKGIIIGVYAIGLSSEISPWAGFASPK